MRVHKTRFTADDLFNLSAPGKRLELVKGEIFEMAPAGGRHGSVAMTVEILLGTHVRAYSLGRVFAAETGFILRRSPDTVRAPDAAFVAAGRLPDGELPTGFLELSPDLVVDVVSPNDRPKDVEEKVEDWLRAGTRLVWVIDPETRSATVYRSLDEVEQISEQEQLDGGEVAPGFSCTLAELFK
ncbi:MAG: Uma2 family endonuclease [SAR202 cluster bacterium]|nr:Uma2 family endonuclease [SAR202 cluster bacterium]